MSRARAFLPLRSRGLSFDGGCPGRVELYLLPLPFGFGADFAAGFALCYLDIARDLGGSRFVGLIE